MSLTIEPVRFTGQPLVTKAIAENDFAVMCDGLPAGRIFLRHVANGASHWFWTITGPALVQPGLSSSGQAASLEEARQAFRAQFDKWLAWALAADVAVYWHQPVRRIE